MVINYLPVGVVREDSVCPYCGSDLVIRIEGDLIFILCIDCEFATC